MVELTVLSLAGETLCHLSGEPDWTGRNLRTQVGEIVHACPCSLQLLIGESCMEDTSMLADYVGDERAADVVLLRRNILVDEGVHELAAQGFCASCLRHEGFDCPSLREAGFDLLALWDEACFDAGDLRDAGFSVRDMVQAGVSLVDPSCFSGIGAHELRQAGCYPFSLMHAGWHPRDVLRAGFTFRDLHMDARTLRAWSFSGDELRTAGFTARQLIAAGFSKEDFREAENLLRGKHHAKPSRDAGLDNSRSSLDDADWPADADFAVVQCKRSVRMRKRALQRAEAAGVRCHTGVLPSLRICALST